MQHRRRLRITAARKNEDGDVRVLTLVHTHSLIRSRCRPALPLYHPCLVIKDTLTNNIHSLYHPTLWETEVSVWAVSSTRTLVWFVLTKTCCNGHKKKWVLRIEKKKQLKGYSVQKNKKQIKNCNLSKVTVNIVFEDSSQQLSILPLFHQGSANPNSQQVRTVYTLDSD